MSAPRKAGYFVLEGLNSFGTAYFFNHFLFHLRDRHGFTQVHTLWLLAAFGVVYAASSSLTGRFAQKQGYFTSLIIGFGGILTATGLAWIWPTLTGQLIALALWSITICFTWPVLEALCSEFEPPGRLQDRIGLYNVVWSVMGALGIATGGLVIERLGPGALFAVPVILHAVQLLLLPGLARQRQAYLTRHGPGSHATPPAAGGPGHFQTMGWIANPLSYMAAHAFTASMPAVAQRLHLSQGEAGVWLGLWNWIRTAGFVALWHWPGWHYRFGLFVAGFGAVIGGFLGVMIAPTLAGSIVAQTALGLGLALTYYSSLFYAMDGCAAHGEQGGTHEALIGIGMGGGPGLTAVAIGWSGSPTFGALAVTVLLGSGLGAIGWIHARARGR